MSDQFNNQRCSKCYQKYSGLRATCYDSSCDREHFFKKNGQLFCLMCLMQEGSIKCQKCSKIITRLEEVGKWRRNVVLVDDHTYDINNFGCECRECNHSENNKKGKKRCQGTFYVHYKGCCEDKPGSIQFNQCDSAIPIDGGDFCQHCKDQTETYQQVKARIRAEEKQEFEKFEQAYEKAQNYWNSLSNSGRERECERIVENIKLGKYWLGEHWINRDVEGYCSGWAHNGSFWGIKNGKLTSSTPHLPPIELAEEFLEKEFGDKQLVLRDCQIIRKDNNDDKNNSPFPNPAAASPQSITNSNEKSDNSLSPGNSPKPNSEKDSLSKEKNSKEDNAAKSTENSPVKTDNQILIFQYLRDIKQVTLTVEGNLVIEFSGEKNDLMSQNQQIITSEQISNNQELQKIRNYCQRNNKSVLSQQELSNILAANSTATKIPEEGSNTLLVGGIICAVLIVGVVTGLLLKNRKVKRN